MCETREVAAKSELSAELMIAEISAPTNSIRNIGDKNFIARNGIISSGSAIFGKTIRPAKPSKIGMIPIIM